MKDLGLQLDFEEQACLWGQKGLWYTIHNIL